MANMISGILDADQENIKSQLEYAKALRGKSLDTDGQMIGPHYVAKNPWQNFIEGLAGGGVESYQRDKQRGIEADIENQFQQAYSQMPSATTTQTYDPVNNSGTGPLLNGVEVPKSYAQLADERQRWATGMSGIRHPLAQAIAQRGMQQAIEAPEKLLEREQAEKLRLQAKQDQNEYLERMAQIYKPTVADQKVIAQIKAPIPGINVVQTDQGIFAVPKNNPSQPIDTGLKPPVSPGQAKLDAAKTAKEETAKKVEPLLNDLETQVDFLDANAGITNTERGGLSNALSWMQNTGIGQTGGKIFGTANQAARNKIENIATNLVLSLKELKGLGASQMNSNFELQKYLTAVAGGQNYDAGSLRAAIKNARSLLGAGDAAGAPTDPNAEARAWLAANPNDPRAPAVRAKLGGK